MKFECIRGNASFSFNGQKFRYASPIVDTDDKGMIDFLSGNVNYIKIEIVDAKKEEEKIVTEVKEEKKKIK
jgi:hypothetical protein